MATSRNDSGRRADSPGCRISCNRSTRSLACITDDDKPRHSSLRKLGPSLVSSLGGHERDDGSWSPNRLVFSSWSANLIQLLASKSIETKGRLRPTVWTLWALTQSGDSLKESDFHELPRIVRQAGYAARKNREAQDQPEEELESEATALADWREQLLNSIVSISPDAFERLSQRILRESGFTRVLVRRRPRTVLGIRGCGRP